MKLIFVTVLGEILTEEAKKKLNGVSKIEDITCSDGRSRNWYDTMDMTVPQSLIDNELEFLQKQYRDEDFEKVKEIGFFNLRDFSLCIDNIKEGSTIFLRSDLKLTVGQSAEEIYDLIE